jgi:hypothetical protein
MRAQGKISATWQRFGAFGCVGVAVARISLDAFTYRQKSSLFLAARITCSSIGLCRAVPSRPKENSLMQR